jgi:preprotein translocase subunit SecA
MVWDMAEFDVQLLGGIVCTGTNRGNGDWRRQDTGGDFTALPERVYRARLAPGHCERLSGTTHAEWMGQSMPGVNVGCIQHDQEPDVRREQYAMDITYGTNSEFGFDYLGQR